VVLFRNLRCKRKIPQSALQEKNSGVVRLKKIQNLIKKSKFGIHDISRTQLDLTHKLPRFNMPFELGIDIGAKEFGSSKLKNKVMLIFDTEEYRYQKFLSDIAGQDISTHENTPHLAIRKIRALFASHDKNKPSTLPSNKVLTDNFERFKKDLSLVSQELKLDDPVSDYNDIVMITHHWLTINF
jgi:hypothetical protein